MIPKPVGFYLLKRIGTTILTVSLLLIASLACGMSTPAQPTQAESPSEAAISTDEAEQTDSTEGAVGSSRSNPFPYSDSIISVPGWDVQILEVVRGEEAMSRLEAANGFRPSSENVRDDQEILLLKLHVKNTQPDEQYPLFQLTGDRLVWYDPFVPVPNLQPELGGGGDDVISGGETEGWTGYLIGKGEGNLLLINSDFEIQVGLDGLAAKASAWFIALEEGASIAIPQGLKDVQPTELGRDRSNPALITETVTGEEWALSVKEVLRGEEAWQKLEAASPFNRRPPQGLEYILVNVHVRYINAKDKVSPYLTVEDFKLIGGQNILYDAPSILEIRSPEPYLQVRLFPGGEYTGWIVLQSAADETGLILVFDPVDDSGGQNRRYILLGP